MSMRDELHYVSVHLNKNYQEEKKLHAPTLQRNLSFYYLDSYVAFDSEQKLGSGVYGYTYLFHTEEGSETVVKWIRYKNDEQLKEIKHEAELNRIYHDIGDLDIDENHKICYLRMKKLPTSLDKTFFAKPPTKQFKDIKEFLKFFITLLEATQELHKKFGIVHGDLKWSNICMSEEGVILFCDFGLARKLKQNIDDPTPEYTSGKWHEDAWHLAPELEKEILAHPSQDVYSIGMFLREAVKELFPKWKYSFGFQYQSDELSPFIDFYRLMIQTKPYNDEEKWISWQESGRIPLIRILKWSKELMELYNKYESDSSDLIKMIVQWNKDRYSNNPSEKKDISSTSSTLLISKMTEIPITIQSEKKEENSSDKIPEPTQPEKREETQPNKNPEPTQPETNTSQNLIPETNLSFNIYNV